MARALAEIAPDLKVGIAGPLGRLPPEVDLRELTDRDVCVDDLWSHRGQSGKCVSIVEGADRTLITFNDAAATRTLANPRGRDELAFRLARARHVHVTSLFGRVAPSSDRRRTHPTAQGSTPRHHQHRPRSGVGAKPSLRCAPPGEADLVFINSDELALLTPPSVEADDQEIDRRLRVGEVLALSRRPKARAYFKALDDRAATGQYRLAHAGGILFEKAGAGKEAAPRESLLVEALPAGAIADSTGAGDVFAAGILAENYSASVRATSGLRVALDAVRHKIQRTGTASYDGLGSVRRL